MSSMINSSQEIFNELTISGLFGKWDVLLPPAFFFFFPSYSPVISLVFWNVSSSFLCCFLTEMFWLLYILIP